MVFVKQAETEILILQFDQSKIAENIWKHLEKVYLPLVKMGLHDVSSTLEQ